MNRTVDILKLSKFILFYFKVMGDGITHIKLQKLLYFIQGWNLGYIKHPLFNDSPEAWVNGPVYVKVYNKYKKYKDKQIPVKTTKEINEITLDKKAKGLKLNSKQQELLNATLQHYGKESAFKLVYRTHVDAPWNDARKGLKPFDLSKTIITHKSMQDFYGAKVKERSKQR